MADRVGQQLGNYGLTRLLGEGGFAEVYLGEHIHLGTQAAIKVLHTQLTSDDVDKFRTEARTIARLIHPHIVRVLEFGVEGKTPFLVMDYAPNGTLRQRHPRGTRLPLDVVVDYVKQIADALQYAHDERVVHRDVKPENMLVGRRNVLLLSDFGIALVAQSSRYQSALEMAGTMAYMAPEQIQGKPRPASDQYSLGVVVYEWLTGDRPFHGSLTELVGQHLSVPPPSLQEKLPKLPSTVEEVVLTALAKDPKERFGSVQAFATALEQASQAGQVSPTVARSLLQPVPLLPSEQSTYVSQPVKTMLDSPSYVEPTSSPNELEAATAFPVSNTTRVVPLTIRRRGFSRGKTALLIGLALLLVGSLSLLYTTIRNNVTTPQTTTTVSTTTHTTGTTNIYATATAATSAYDTAVTTNGIMFGFDAQHSHFDPYEKVLSTSNVSQLGQAWVYTTSGSINASSPAVANGVVYIGSLDHSLYALDARSGTKLWSYTTGKVITSSPAVANGVVYIGSWDYSLYALDAHSGTKLWSYTTGYTIDSSPAVANGVVYIGSDDGSLYALDARSGTKLWSYTTRGQIDSSPAIANGVVYFGVRSGGKDNSLYALDARSGTKLWSYTTGDLIDSSPAVANGVVYIGSYDRSLYALDARSGTKLWSYTTGGPVESSPAVVNSAVYFGSDDGSLYALDARSGTKLWSTTGGLFSSPTVANGVVYVASDDHSLYALDAQSGIELWSYATGGPIYNSPAVANGVAYIGSLDWSLYAFHVSGTIP